MTYDEFYRQWTDNTTSIPVNTSGSTGVPKKLLLPKSDVEASARRTISFFNLTSKSRLHSALAADYIAGKMMMVRALMAGCDFTYEEPTNRPNLISELSNGKISLLCVVPSQLWHIIENRHILPEIENIIVGGSEVPRELLDAIDFASDWDTKIYETYGMTETASHIALRRLNHTREKTLHTLPGITVSKDERGCLVIRDNSTGKRFVTNDVARIYSSTTFNILGRYDNAIISGGIKIHPEELEREYPELISGRKWYFTSRKDAKWGNHLVMVVQGTDPLSASELEKIKATLPKYKIPKEIVYLPTFSHTATGKIRRLLP